MRHSALTLFLVLFLALAAGAQVGISNINTLPDPSALVDMSSTTKGLLIPRLTLEQIRIVTDPANGLLVFCTTDSKFYAFLSADNAWKEVLYGTGTLAPACGTPFTDPRDGKSYHTVQVGTQCWMAQNLNIGTRINGNQGQGNNGTPEKYCYQNLESNCDVYGGLFQWNEAMQFTTTAGAQGLCPAGWHLPSDAEFMVMVSFLGGLDLAGGKMKETGTSHWTAPNTGATNESGFTVLPASFRDYLGSFSTPLGERASFWTSSENGGTYAWDYGFYYNSDDAIRSSGAMKTNGFSIRCLKN